MPPAAIAPIVMGVMGVASMIGQNVQNKAAMANNDNQRAANLANSKDAYATATQQLAPILNPQNSPAAQGTAGATAPTIAAGKATPTIALNTNRVTPTSAGAAPNTPPGTGYSSLGPGAITQMLQTAQLQGKLNPQSAAAFQQLLSNRQVIGPTLSGNPTNPAGGNVS